MGLKWSEVAATNTVSGQDMDPDEVKVHLLNLDEPDPSDQNQFVTLTNLLNNILGALGVCITFTAQNPAPTAIQDDRLKNKVLSQVRMVVIGGTEIVSLGYVIGLDGVTGTLTLSEDYGGAQAIITLA